MVIESQHQHGADADLGAVKDSRLMVEEELHLPEMGLVMLSTGGRAGIAGEIHGNTGQGQGFGQQSHCLGIALDQTVNAFHSLLHCGAHDTGDGLTVIFAINNRRKPPVAEAIVFAKNIANTGCQHFHRCL